MRRFYYYAHIPILVIAFVSVIFYFDFTAEDAFITYRYSENLVNTGALVFNVGEPINAMTSPLHALVSAALFYLSGQTVLANKILALVLWLAAALVVWYRFGPHPYWRLLGVTLVLLPPSILLWTFGGLETPLLLFLATLSVWLAEEPPPFSLTRLGRLALLAGLAFLTRYDSVLFFVPILLYAVSKARSIKHTAMALAGAAVLPLAWLGVSLTYYGDLLPTSFYVKTPSGSLGNLEVNGIYIASYLLFVGIIPALILAFVMLQSRRQMLSFIFEHFKSLWWLYAGLLLELLYGLTMATTHMMFSFRFFVPYLPAAVVVTVDLVRRAANTRDMALASPRLAALLTGFLACLVVFQTYQTVYTYDKSVNGIALVGEYRSLGVRDYRQFIQVLRQEALDIQKHWATTGGTKDRRPRILTYAAGMLPYTFRDSYIYEQLVSYRHCFVRHNQGLYADYLHILAPRQGAVEQQLPKPESSYALVSSYAMVFDGSQQEFLVYYNPEPEGHNLSATINEPCQAREQEASVPLP